MLSFAMLEPICSMVGWIVNRLENVANAQSCVKRGSIEGAQTTWFCTCMLRRRTLQELKRLEKQIMICMSVSQH